MITSEVTRETSSYGFWIIVAHSNYVNSPAMTATNHTEKTQGLFLASQGKNSQFIQANKRMRQKNKK